MTVSAVEGFRGQVRKEASRIMWLGALLVAVGVVALVFPMVSTLAATIFVAWMLILAGAVTLFGAFSVRGAGAFFGALLFGLLSVAAGVFILARPLAGELAITLCLGALFMVQGAFELVFAFELRPAPRWGWMLVSALASIVLSLLILSGWPSSSLVLLGILIGVNFISSGIAYLALGGAARKQAAS